MAGHLEVFRYPRRSIILLYCFWFTASDLTWQNSADSADTFFALKDFLTYIPRYLIKNVERTPIISCTIVLSSYGLPWLYKSFSNVVMVGLSLENHSPASNMLNLHVYHFLIIICSNVGCSNVGFIMRGQGSVSLVHKARALGRPLTPAPTFKYRLLFLLPIHSPFRRCRRM